MIVLALMENQTGQGTAPKDVFAWMSARWPLNANFRPSASQALQKAYKRGRLEKVGAKYKLNPNWHGGATTNRTTRRPQSMAELPGNYAWAPPPVAPVKSVPPDPRARASTPPSSHSNLPNGIVGTGGAASGSGPEFDAQAHVASLLKALQEAGPPGAPDANAQPGQNLNQNQGQGGPGQGDMPNIGSSAVAGQSNGAPGAQGLLPPPPLPPTGMPNGSQGVAAGPTAPPHPLSSPVAHSLPPIPPPAQPGMPSAPQHGMPQSPHGLPMPSAPTTNGAPGPIPAGVPVLYGGYQNHAPTALQASLASLASQLADMSKSNQGA
ncbi:hypothetical protein BDV93DRAFT_36135 [Ceratobasidium sp. AG-I]|nr:hypothetical protein BDV93DRAFT_36135 [Ceratobasidium sp. AG-I]